MISMFLYLLVFLSSSWADQKHSDSKNRAYCADGWSLVCSNENDCSCFQYVDGYVRYEIAEQICNGFGGNLPSIHSEENNKFLYVFPNDLRRGAWIGLRRINNTFKWVDESDLDYTSWNDDAPTNGANSSDCVHYMGYEDEGYTVPFKWRDSPCTELRPILCEMPLSIPTTTVPPTTTLQPDPCPQNYTEKCFQNNACYCYSVKSSMYWGDGVAACRSEGADMVSIHSSEENNFIREIIPSTAWIGCLYSSIYWVDGTYMNYENWYSSYNSYSLGYIDSSGYWQASSSTSSSLIVVCKVPTYSDVKIILHH
ncbi:macrophage mannose receptor 1-like [Artemia franciscana]|uniref:macrophage mannose receptor 1-like n=1 Tax=Artemia franciscana TaxID=6661 RepID=UPI0032DB3BBD